MRCGINNPTHNSDWSWIKRPNALKYIIWSMCWGVLTVVKTLLGPTSRLHHSASWRQNKANTGGGPFKTVLIRLHTELKIYFVVMLDARFDVVKTPFLNFKGYLLPLPDKKPLTTVVKQDKTSTGQKWSRISAHTYQKRFNKVLSFVVMGTSEDFLHLTNMSYMKYTSVCMCVKQQTDYLYAA